jgi:hypothetical protein
MYPGETQFEYDDEIESCNELELRGYKLSNSYHEYPILDKLCDTIHYINSIEFDNYKPKLQKIIKTFSDAVLEVFVPEYDKDLKYTSENDINFESDVVDDFENYK